MSFSEACHQGFSPVSSPLSSVNHSANKIKLKQTDLNSVKLKYYYYYYQNEEPRVMPSEIPRHEVTLFQQVWVYHRHRLYLYLETGEMEMAILHLPCQK